MNRLRHATCVAFLLLLPALAVAQPQFPTYRSLSDLTIASPGAYRWGLDGFLNPALLATLDRPDFQLDWTDGGGQWNAFQRWGLFAAVPSLSFGMVHDKTLPVPVTEYRVSLGAGNRSGGFGISYGWSGGGDDSLDRPSNMLLGFLSRPNRYASIGLTGAFTFGGTTKEAVLDVGIRPFGTAFVTLFVDYSLRERDRLFDGTWSAGAVVEPIDGVRLSGRYMDLDGVHGISLGAALSLGGLGLQSNTALHDAGDGYSRAATSYSLRVGGYDRTFLRSLGNGSARLSVSLGGSMTYQRFALFDNSQTLEETLDAIDAAKDDPLIAGIAINASDMAIDREMLWEIREKLLQFKRSGKYVIAFFERADLDDYALISVADRIVIDPLGDLELRGYASGRTYYREMLDKLGIGFREIRLFRYKSAYENFARDSMSEGEREQRQEMVNVMYRTARQDIVSSGRIASNAEFDRIVDSVVIMRAEDAVQRGLADTMARWDDIGAVAESMHRGGLSTVGTGSLQRFQRPNDDRWSEPPRVAIVYALGGTSLTGGMNARSLSGEIDALAGDGSVKAIVVRVDSPGGDALAADLVAESIRKATARKPVIISQGTVAASGGYWVSMYGDQILAAPTTISGSIGVISAWLWNDGAFDSLGAKFDYVQRGRHADLTSGPSLPFIGLGLPHRDLTPEELARYKELILASYQTFKQKVAQGRGLSVDSVQTLAQGRVWMGADAVNNGLVDRLGGLDLAVALARERAGLKPDEEVTIEEVPGAGLFDPALLRFGLPDISTKQEQIRQSIQFLIDHNGQPIPMLPSEIPLQ